jgi:hypothetical protein
MYFFQKIQKMRNLSVEKKNLCYLNLGAKVLGLRVDSTDNFPNFLLFFQVLHKISCKKSGN